MSNNCMSYYYDFVQCTKNKGILYSLCQKKLDIFQECVQMYNKSLKSIEKRS